MSGIFQSQLWFKPRRLDVHCLEVGIDLVHFSINRLIVTSSNNLESFPFRETPRLREIVVVVWIEGNIFLVEFFCRHSGFAMTGGADYVAI